MLGQTASVPKMGAQQFFDCYACLPRTLVRVAFARNRLTFCTVCIYSAL